MHTLIYSISAIFLCAVAFAGFAAATWSLSHSAYFSRAESAVWGFIIGGICSSAICIWLILAAVGS